MGHGITRKDTMAYAGNAPWHGLGTYLGDEPIATGRRMLELAGLDWEVATGPLYGPDMRPISHRVAIWRPDTGAVLGVPTSVYEVYQNHEAVDFMDGLLADGVMRYETAGSIMGCRRAWALARLADDMRIGEDVLRQYMLITWGHDGGTAVKVAPTAVRVVCYNTLAAASAFDKTDRGEHQFYLRHTTNLHERMAQAQGALQITTGSMRKLAEYLQRAAEVKVTEAGEQAVIEEIFGPALNELESVAGRNDAERRGTFMRILGEEQGRVGPTAYALINAVTGYADHALNVRAKTPELLAERRFRSVTEGDGFKLKERGLSAVRQLVPVR